MYYRNQEILKTRFEQFCQFNLLEPLDQIYKELRLNLSDRDKNNYLEDNSHQPDCFQTQEIFAFPQQSEVLYQAYGGPTVVTFNANYSKKTIFIGTQQSIIICINIVHGRTEKIEAIFNSGENQNRYGSVQCIEFSGRFMICGFQRGDVQIFEVCKKWERMQHLSHCHKHSIIATNFIQSNREQDQLEAISLDSQGILIKHQINVMNIMDRLIVKSSQDVIYENGKCRKSPTISKQQPLVKKQSWWSNAKSLFQSDNKETKSEISTQSFKRTEPSIRYSEEERDSYNNILALDMKVMPEDLALSLQQNYKKYVIIAIQYFDRIELIKVIKGSLKCEIIYTLKRNNISIDNELTFNKEQGEISWGEGYFQRSYQNAQLLSCRWGDVFHLVKCINIEEDLEIVEGAVLKIETNNSEIIKSGFLTNNIICVAMTNDSISLVHTTQFQFAKQIDDFIILEPRTRMLSREDIDIQSSEINIEYESQNYPYETVCNIDNNNIIQLRKGRLLIERLQTWEEYLQDLIDKNQWEKALSQGMLIYQGQIKILGKVASSLVTRQKQMKEVLEKVAFTHIMFLLKPIDITQKFHQDDLEKKIKQTFEFLINTDNTTYILTLLKDFFKNLDELKLFFVCFEPFVIGKQINEINDSFFQDFVNHYTNSNKQMISNLILQLDLSQQEPTILIKTCMDLQLYKAMIYLCTKQGDFITALMKLVDLWENKFQEEIKEQNLIEKENLRKFRIKLGFNIQAYIRMCFKGINIQGERVPQALFKDMLRGLLKYLFNLDNLKQFLMIDLRISLQLLISLFHSRLMLIIGQLDNILQLDEPKSKIIEESSSIPIVLIQAINTLEQCRLGILDDKCLPPTCNHRQLTREEINYHFCLFYSRILPQVNYNMEFKQNLIHQLLQPGYYEDLKLYNYPNLEDKELSEQTYQVNQNSYLIYLYDQAEMYDQINQYIDKSIPFPEFRAYLLYSLRQYKNCFHIYLEQKNILMKYNIFEVIQRLLNRKLSNMDEIKELIISLASQLTEINGQISYEIFKNYFTEDKLQMKIIKQLETFPQGQLFYLKSYIKSNNSCSDEIRMIYLELLCLKSPKDVLLEVQLRQFPLDDALKVVEKYKIYNAVAYLLQKSGAIQKALEMFSQMFFVRLKESHKSFAKTKSISEQDQIEIFEKLQYIIELIVNSQQQDENYESLWYQFLDNFFKDFKPIQLTDTKIPVTIRKLHCDIVSEVFFFMSQCVSLDLLLDKLQCHYGSIPVRVFWKTNEAFKSKFAFEGSTYELALKESQKTYNTLLKELTQLQTKAIIITKDCTLCQDAISKGTQAIAFQCGHHFHQECFIEQFGQNNQSFNSLKIKNIKFLHNCFVCLQNPTEFLNHTILQIKMKKQGMDFKQNQQSKNQKTGPPIQEYQNKKQQIDQSMLRKKKLRLLSLHDHTVQQKQIQQLFEQVY